MLITVDWLAFRVRSLPDNDIFSFLGFFDVLDWRVGGPCFNSYLDSLRYGHITIGLNGTKGYDFYVQLTGQGCREFEDLHYNFSWDDFLFRLSSDDNVSFSRLDIAGDERDGYFTIDRLDNSISLHKYSTRCGIPSLTKYGREICYVGSSQSNILMRIYNKKMERGYSPNDDDGLPWWRCELQLRDEYCNQFINDWRSFGLGKAYSGHCKNHIRFLSKPNDTSNSHRLNTAKWYDDFLGVCEPLKFSSTVGTTYNISRLQRYCITNAGSSVVTLCKFFDFSPDQLYNYFVDNDKIKLRADQQDLIKMFRGNK